MASLTFRDSLAATGSESHQLPSNDEEKDPLPSIKDARELLFVLLCPACQRLMDKLDIYLEKIDAGAKYVALEDTRPPGSDKLLSVSAREGCGLCQALALGLHSDSRPTSHHDLTIYEDTNSEQYRRNVIFYLKRRDGEQNDLGHIFSAEWSQWKIGDFTSKVFFFPRKSMFQLELEESTASRTSLEFAKRSLQACTGSHHKCQIPDTAFSPTRLIELRRDGCRLETDIAPATPYTTLSHCWGSIEIFKLKKDNIIDLQDDIPLERLCKTFQDAILVTGSLGFSYIWIDSVCIIQDDVDDWRRESGKMSQVYGNSMVNIAATSAKDGSIGLFTERSLTAMRSQYISTPQKRLLEFAAMGFYARCISSAPLTSRAWTFQERYLAERTLHFTGEQIFWECRENMACETLPDKFPPSMVPWYDVFPSTVNPDDWCQTVSVYSRGRLTYCTDKLVAISGVARKFQERTPDQYLAGLWRRNIGRQLCWRKLEPSAIYENDCVPYRAPSWSWASTDCPVTWTLYTTNDVSLVLPGHGIFIRILNFTAVLAGSDELGQIESAELQLKCPAFIKISALDGIDACLTYSGCLYYDMEDRSRDRSDYWILPIMNGPRIFPDYSHEVIGETSLYGLIVERVEKRGKGYFARVGVCDIQVDGGKYGAWISDLLASDESKILMDESHYQEILEQKSDGLKQYSITLI